MKFKVFVIIMPLITAGNASHFCGFRRTLLGGYFCLKLLGKIVRFDQSSHLYLGSAIVKIARERKISTLHPFFKNKPQSALLMTNNFITLNSGGLDCSPVGPLGKEQKPAYEVLVVEDELPNGKKKLTVIMGDQSTDAHFWRQKLAKDVSETPADIAHKAQKKNLSL